MRLPLYARLGLLLFLLSCSGDPDDPLAAEIEELIQNLKSSPIALRKVDLAQRNKAHRRLVAIGEPAVPALLRALKRDWRIGDHIELVLGDIGEPALPHILEMRNDEKVIVRHHLVNALGRIGGDAALQALHDALKDEHPSVRASAASALRKTRSKTSVPFLEDVLADESPNVKSAAALALAEIGDPSSCRPLVALLVDVDENVAKSAHHALVRITGKDQGTSKEAWTEFLDREKR